MRAARALKLLKKDEVLKQKARDTTRARRSISLILPPIALINLIRNDNLPLG